MQIGYLGWIDQLYIVISLISVRRFSSLLDWKIRHNIYMLTSELAEELHVDPSVITKMRNTYRQEAELETAPPLKGEVLKVLREAHALKLESKNMTYRQAIRQRLGLATEPLTAEGVGVLEKRLAALEHAALRQDEKLNTVLQQLGELMQQLRMSGEQKTGEAPSGRPEGAPLMALSAAAGQEDGTQVHDWARELVPEDALSGHDEPEEPENP